MHTCLWPAYESPRHDLAALLQPLHGGTTPLRPIIEERPIFIARKFHNEKDITTKRYASGKLSTARFSRPPYLDAVLSLLFLQRNGGFQGLRCLTQNARCSSALASACEQAVEIKDISRFHSPLVHFATLYSNECVCTTHALRETDLIFARGTRSKFEIQWIVDHDEKQAEERAKA